MTTLSAGRFETFPLPDYAAKFVDGDYSSYFVEVEPGIKIHVLEVGSGYPVYMQHGAPTSGFLYRKVADALPRDRFRVIMPTMVGLGFSSKVPASEHTLDNHIRWMNALLNRLTLERVIFVGHDWGGPVGMGALSRSPDLIEGAVILNTVIEAPTEKKSFPTALRIAKTPVIGELVMERMLSIFDQLPGLQADPETIPPNVIELYERPVVESGNQKGPLAILRMAADGPDHPTAAQTKLAEEYAKGLDIPAEIVWGTKDPILGLRIPVMQSVFPEAPVIETEAGHFVQEVVPEEIAAALVRVHERINAPR